MATELPPRRTEAPITSSSQLLVEGNDQRNFFEAMVEHLKLADIQIRNFGGVNELRSYLAAFVNMARFSAVRRIGIVRDAEKSAASAFQSVQSALRNANLPVPDRPAKVALGKPNVNVLVIPDSAESGMLETLLCETFAGTPEDRCIDELFACVRPAGSDSGKGSAKARCRVWLATRPDPQLSSVGVAAKRGYWDLDHTALESTQAFLKTLAEEPCAITATSPT